MSRRIISSFLMALLLAGFLAGAAEAREGIRGPGFRAFAPSGWHIDKQAAGGWNMTTITPPGHVSNQRDTALVSIAVTSVKRVEKATRLKIRDKNALVKKLISIPSNAADVEPSFQPRPTVLRGKRGVVYGVHYTFTGHGTVHNATLVRRGKRIYLMQVITDQDVTEIGGAAATSILNSWSWR